MVATAVAVPTLFEHGSELALADVERELLNKQDLVGRLWSGSTL